mmetsp:Transcript_90156/g.160564  ORF Transcript_90156/g.160564 Transcript_90156/m.160564 type:complete len:748 (+) Transcript_90156:57-2300(+)
MGCTSSKAEAGPAAPATATTLLVTGSKEAKAVVGEADAVDRALHQQSLVIRVAGAELYRSFETFGKMDPFVVLEHLPAGGRPREFARTRTDWGGHMKPSWDHTCRAVEVESTDVVRFRLLEKNFGDFGTPTFCGEASATVRELLQGNLNTSAERAPAATLTLSKHGEETGRLVIHAGLNHGSKDGFGRVSAKLFESPVARLPGSSSLFALKRKGETCPESWIGQDLARANAELSFYEKVRQLRQVTSSPSGFHFLLPFLLDYEGVAECSVEGEKVGDAPKQLLVLENLGSVGVGRCFRRLDLKLGQARPSDPASKSRLAAIRHSLLEGFGSCSHCEGFRLERFEGPPAALESADPLLDLGGGKLHGEVLRRRARKAMLQRMQAAEMFMHLINLPSASGADRVDISEKLLRQVLSKLSQLAVACRKAPAPQSWLGSSLGLTVNFLPESKAPEASVKLFDWGQAELVMPEAHKDFSPAERRERAAQWRQYIGSIDELSWEAARCYHHRFGNDHVWREVHFAVADFDSMSAADFIGEASLSLDEENPTVEMTLPLLARGDAVVFGKNGLPSTLTVRATFNSMPLDRKDRFRAFWQVQIVSADNLPARDPLTGSSDPWVSVTAVGGKDGEFSLQQSSSVVPRNLQPEWNESFELALAVPGSRHLSESLDLVAPGIASKFAGLMASSKEEKAGLLSWASALAHAADRVNRGLAPAPVAVPAGGELEEPAVLAFDSGSKDERSTVCGTFFNTC